MINIIIFFNGANLAPAIIEKVENEFFKRYQNCIPYEIDMKIDYTTHAVKCVFVDRVFAAPKRVRVTNTNDNVYFYLEV